MIIRLALVTLFLCCFRLSGAIEYTLPESVSLPQGQVFFHDLLPEKQEDISNFPITALTGKSPLKIHGPLIQAAYRSHFNSRFPGMIHGTTIVTLAMQEITEDRIQQAILATIPDAAESSIIEKGATWIIPATQQPATLIARCLAASHSGKTAFVVTAINPDSGKEIDRTLYHGHIAYYSSVYVTIKHLETGQVLTPQAVTEKRVLVRSPSDSTSPARFLGKQLRQDIPAGTVIEQHMLTHPWLVNARQAVTIQWRSANFLITSKGTAITNGSLGEIVQIKGHNGEKLQATVVGPNRVQIGGT